MLHSIEGELRVLQVSGIDTIVLKGRLWRALCIRTHPCGHMVI